LSAHDVDRPGGQACHVRGCRNPVYWRVELERTEQVTGTRPAGYNNHWIRPG
jgi:hypothetical protein